MTVSLATLRTRVRRELQDEPWEDPLSGAIAAAGTLTMTITTPASWSAGDRAEFDDDTGEVARVTQAANGANPVPIKRSHNGSTAIAHSNGATVLKNPRFEYNSITDALNDSIAALWPDAWVALAVAQVVPVSGVHWYSASTGAVGLISVKQLHSGTTLDFTDYGRKNSGFPVSFEERHPSFTDGPAIGIPTFYSLTANVRVVYAAKVDSSTVAEGDMAKFVVNDTARRLLEGEELERTQQDIAQGDTGVTVGSLVRNAAYFAAQSEKARRDLAHTCKRDLPLMRPWGR